MEKKPQNTASDRNENPAPQGSKWQTIIRYNCRSYDKLNVARFYTKLQTLRSQLSGAGTDSNTSAGTDTAPQS